MQIDYRSVNDLVLVSVMLLKEINSYNFQHFKPTIPVIKGIRRLMNLPARESWIV
jgi:hypothetical protein